MAKIHGKVVRVTEFEDWNGHLATRIDIATAGSPIADVHVYLNAAHPMAELGPGGVVEIDF